MIHHITVPDKHTAGVISVRKADHFIGGAPTVYLISIREDYDQTYLREALSRIKNRHSSQCVKALCATSIEGSDAVCRDEFSDDLAQGRAEVWSLLLWDMPMARTVSVRLKTSPPSMVA